MKNIMQWAVTGLCVGLALALYAPLVVAHFSTPLPKPELDENTRAYVLLVNGLKVGRYAAAKEMFDQAYSMSDDAEIRYLADFFSQTCKIALNAGIDSFNESGSAIGGVKALVRGFYAPMDSLSAVILLIQQYFGDYNKNCQIVDERYQTRIKEYLSLVQTYDDLKNNESHFYGVFLIGMPIAFVMFATNQKKNQIAG